MRSGCRRRRRFPFGCLLAKVRLRHHTCRHLGRWTCAHRAGLMMAECRLSLQPSRLDEDQKSSPFELSLDWAVTSTAGVQWQAGVASREGQGDCLAFIGIEIEWNSFEALYKAVNLSTPRPMIPWRSSTPIYRDGSRSATPRAACGRPLLKNIWRSPIFAHRTMHSIRRLNSR